MPNEIKEILQDLYLIDGDLKKHEKELLKIINELLAKRPNAKFDAKFASELKEKLLLEFEKDKSEHKNILLTNIFSMKKIVFFSGAVAFLILLALVPMINNFYHQQKPGNATIVSKNSGHGEIAKIADNAFGSLASLSNVSGGSKTDSLTANAAPKTTSVAPSIGLVAPGAAVSSKMMPPYEMINYKYVYKGEDFKLDSDKMEVFKRIKGGNNSDGMANLLSSNIGLGLINFNNQNQYALQNVSFAQNQPYGYYFNINMDEGSISLYQNWNYWPQSKCQDQACFDAEKLTKADVPSDEQLISISNDFVKKYGITLDSYDAPEVVKTSNIMYAGAMVKSAVAIAPVDEFIPEYVNVIYPLKIKDKVIYENGAGAKTGLSITISVREKKVSSVYNLNTQNYQSSDYATENDFSKLKNIAEKGGLYSWDNPSATKTVELELGTPSVVYMRYWQYLNNSSEELLIPTLVFPVSSTDSSINSYQTTIALPLVRDILDSQTNVGGGVITPMMTTEKAVR
ncbi:MAG: hypothetical protein WCK37_00200 [Candidatus Falkowbacteria bacterium]